MSNILRRHSIEAKQLKLKERYKKQLIDDQDVVLNFKAQPIHKSVAVLKKVDKETSVADKTYEDSSFKERYFQTLDNERKRGNYTALITKDKSVVNKNTKIDEFFIRSKKDEMTILENYKDRFKRNVT